MADAVASALQDGSIQIVEAPTGVGKSIAYMVPGALWARGSQKRLLVSTHTRHLQDQILRRDLPLLRRLTDRRIEAAVLKGRANYLCRRRWQVAREDLLGTTDGEAFVRLMEGWIPVTESGDFDEGPIVPPRLRPLLSRISSDARSCATTGCDADSGCFFKLSRKRAREAHIVLVNHSLLVLDLLHGSVGLPDWDGAILDEAHHLPRIAGDALARRMSGRAWNAAMLGLGGQGEPGASDLYRRLARAIPDKEERQRRLRRVREVESELGRLLERSRAFFADLRATAEVPPATGRERYRQGAGSGGPFPESTYPLLEAASGLLDRHEQILRDVLPAIAPMPAGEQVAEAIVPEIRTQLDAAREALDALTFLVEADAAETVYWFERDGEDLSLHSRPLQMSGPLGERLVSGRAVVLTSATLAADRGTEFFARQCGLPADTPSLILPPVFDLASQVKALVPARMPEPTAPGHEADLAEGIVKLATALPRKLLVLFTAHETLRRVEERIRTPLQDRGVRVYAQGRDAGGRQALISGFVESERAVLLGAASFWEGVDFPGEDLEILVMARLPFPVPTDPFVEAYAERLREDGRDAFDDYMLPEAIVRFRQGFGRLIRSREDRGVFAVLDARILTRRYGSRFREAIGIPVEAPASWDALVQAAEAWFRH
ncbi:MAG: ATP-dependent DNA helicase [Candidatus Eisenbacteria bacterium]